MKASYLFKIIVSWSIVLISLPAAKGQVDISKKEYIESYTGAMPCYTFLYPQKLFELPDSLSLKKHGETGTFMIAVIFDSSCNLIGIRPFTIRINKKSEKPSEESVYYFDDVVNYRSHNFPRSEAMAFLDWAVKNVPATIKVSRLPYRCSEKEKKEAILWYFLEFQME